MFQEICFCPSWKELMSSNEKFKDTKNLKTNGYAFAQIGEKGKDAKKLNKWFFCQVGEDVDRKKRPRTAFTAAQIKALEAEFERNK